MPSNLLDIGELDSRLEEVTDASRWYIGFSGGVDSSVLLDMLARRRAARRHMPELAAIHVDHGLQEVAAAWPQHCQAICDSRAIPLIRQRVAVVRGSLGLEAAAREARYRVFEEILKPGDVLLLAHHLDDQVETVFLRLLRGAGVTGLAAIPRKRPLGAGILLRPLLDFTRQQIVNYAKRHELSYIDDPDNDHSGPDRNFIRREVLPLIATRWPGYRQTVQRAAADIAATADTLEASIPAPATVHSTMGDPGINLEDLTASSLARSALLLRRWLRDRNLQAPDRVALETFLQQLYSADRESAPRLECGAFGLQRYREGVYLLPPDFPPRGPAVEHSLGPGESIRIAGVGALTLQATDANALLLAAGERLQIRWRQGGERCRLPGRAGSRSLKQLLQERGVPSWWRRRIPLLYLGDELLAIGDLWCCESSRWRRKPQVGESLWQLNWQPDIQQP